MPCRFHREALRRLGVEPVLDPSAVRALDGRASALGVRLPRSFVTWYGLRDGVSLLGRLSNCDVPIEIEQLGAPLRWRWTEAVDWVRRGLLPFLIECQAVCLWALRLEAGDDPPVVVARDPDLAWRPCAETFSAFIECQAWDLSEIGSGTEPGGPRLLLQAQDRPLQVDDLRLLRRDFEERPTTQGWPGASQHRFQRGEARVLLWNGEDQADWFISAASEAGLAEVAGGLWACGDLRGTLWSHDERCARVLETLRS